MKQMTTKELDFEKFGFQTMLETQNEQCAKEICALELHAYERSLAPDVATKRSGIQLLKHRAAALHFHLYDRPIPVSDAAMLVCSLGVRTLLVLATLAASASLAGNTVMFYLFGFGLLVTFILALGTTALPLVVGHLAYEKIIARNKILQTVVILLA